MFNLISNPGKLLCYMVIFVILLNIVNKLYSAMCASMGEQLQEYIFKLIISYKDIAEKVDQFNSKNSDMEVGKYRKKMQKINEPMQ